MKTIGELLKEARIKKKYSFDKLEQKTRIKKDFIVSIEKEEWSSLPSFSTVLGFVKSLAATLGFNQNHAAALLKRDYPPTHVDINPKPDVQKKFTWSPKLTFIVSVGVVLIAILGYLTFQYIRFVSPPKLIVDSPKENQAVKGNSIIVSGQTDPDVKVVINKQPVIIDDDGNFSVSLEVVTETKEITIKALSRSGKETLIYRNIEVESN
ncbi:helix-turn-helix domain-containing protein [Patescibacteria group bacterium]